MSSAARCKAGYMLTEGRKITKIPKDAPVIRWREFMNMGRSCFWNYAVKRTGDDPAVILYSGGTTGTTKGILLTNLQLQRPGPADHRHQPHVPPRATRCSPSCPSSTASAWACASTPCSPRAARCILVPRFTAKSYAKLHHQVPAQLHRRRPHPLRGAAAPAQHGRRWT